MAYLNKNDVLKAYKVLSELRPNPTAQGATQNVSALRHVLALDMFYKNEHTNCNTRDRIHKTKFNEYVGVVCSVCDSLYTPNFYYPLKHHDGDFSVGSNFYSAGQVVISINSTSQTFDYPKRGNIPLMKINNGLLIRVPELYGNINSYLLNKNYKLAFVIWLLRNKSLNAEEPKKLVALREALKELYTEEMVAVLLPEDPEFSNILAEYSLNLQEDIDAITESDIKGLFNISSRRNKEIMENVNKAKYRQFITAIKSKPFLLLAGISGTGKSRIVRELARACWAEDSEEYKAQKPRNFEMVQVKPNWHDSTELLGYVSRVSGTPEFVPGDFLRFIVKAWEEPDVPYLLCLDEMNLAPVEQYFAEFLSVIESRKAKDGVTIVTDPILKKVDETWYSPLTFILTEDDALRERFNSKDMDNGICLPQNLIVIGTVNMDETTYSFSRKVLDRAMTIEMNEFDIRGGLERENTTIDLLLNKDNLIGTAVEGKDVYSDNKEVCEIALDYLSKVNEVLKDTPFAVAYRTRNEFLLYVVNNLPYNKDEKGNDLPEGFVIARALDEITSMKILSRIEGDDTKVSEKLLSSLREAIDSGLKEISSNEPEVKSISLAKIDEMKRRLLSSGYTSYWS